MMHRLGDLGGWQPFIHPEMFHWYDLHPGMKEELCSFRPDGHELKALSASDYRRFHEYVVRWTDASIANQRVAYHIPLHFRTTERNGLDAASTYSALTGTRLPQAVLQSLGCALYSHDAYYCGTNFRADVLQPALLHLPEYRNASQEWVTALAFSAQTRAWGMNLPWRLFATQIHWASTYGGHLPRGRQLGIPIVRPRGLWGCITQASDLCPYPEPVQSLKVAIDVLYGEVPSAPVAPVWNTFLESQKRHLTVVEATFDALDRAAGKKLRLTHCLGWRGRLDELTTTIQALIKGQDPGLKRHLLQYTEHQYSVSLR